MRKLLVAVAVAVGATVVGVGAPAPDRVNAIPNYVRKSTVTLCKQVGWKSDTCKIMVYADCIMSGRPAILCP